MRIRIDEIPESGRFLHFHWDEERLKEYLPPEDPHGIALERPVNVDLEVLKERDHIHIRGSIKGVLRVFCHRCLEPFLWTLNETVDTFLVEEQSAPVDEEEVELEREDLEYEFFDGEVIEMDRLVAEQIFLALPVKSLCSETCRGLCPSCGANLNSESCRCEKKDKDSPFSVLESIKTQLPS